MVSSNKTCIRLHALLCVFLIGCSTAATGPQTAITTPQTSTASPQTSVMAPPPVEISGTAMRPVPSTQGPVAPLPFKGRLTEGTARVLPPAVAASLSNSGDVTFSYREEMSHDHYTVPLFVSAIDPATYFGYPLGKYGVTAFAALTIKEGDRVLGDYTAQEHVTQNYTLYYQPTYIELEHSARAAVQDKIDQQLYRDADRLAQTVHSSPQ